MTLPMVGSVVVVVDLGMADLAVSRRRHSLMPS